MSKMSILRFRGSQFALFALVSLGLLVAGCAREDSFCDSEGCYVCDGLGCREAEPPERTQCRGDFECEQGTVCTDMGCVSTCSSEDGCPEGTLCRQVSEGLEMCLSPTEPSPEPQPGECERSEDCGDPGLICRDGLCEPDDRECGDAGCDCSETGACSEGFYCIDGQCRSEENVCRFNTECGPDRVCLDGECAAECGPDRACPQGQQCEEGICRDLEPPTGECTENADCGQGGVCVDSTCYDACEAHADCGDGRYCRDGVCRIDDRPHPFCAGDADCQPGHPCINGACRTPCDTDEECLRYDVQFRVCLDGFCATTNEATANCTTSEDCSSGAECIDGVCQ
jgi:hypothetical protein